ncbi:MAG: lipopolysaccharide heptosyltransferase II [Candidatus Omnitrophica bacterium]|nr:lipopolysaccharide heptosyltransferase II [Candidatus Omnitrophota bacterium]
MSKPNKILFITLSNIGDVILTLPVLDSLREKFPQSKVTVLVGPRPKEIFQGNPCIDKLIIYDKHARLTEKIRLFRELKKENFDMVVDLRNSLFGVFLPARYRTSPFRIAPNNIEHMRDRHLYRAQSAKAGKAQSCLNIKPEDEEYINQILKENNITGQDSIVVVSPGARSHIKRWDKEKFVRLCNCLLENRDTKIILVGEEADGDTAAYIKEKCSGQILNLCNKTNLLQLAVLLKKAKLLITNDSAVLHLGSYLNIGVVAVFGPTNERKYRPWSDNFAVVKKEIFCRPCQKAQCRFRTLDCMKLIKVEDVLTAVRRLLVTNYQLPITNYESKFKRILIVRTDRIGDVLLSTPVIKALRQEYPCALIAMMVGPYAREIIEGNSYLDEVIIYDKNGKHKSWYGTLKFAHQLKKKRFDLALILHPANRVHLVTFFAGIQQRIGYNRKFGFLLTDKVKHTKQSGRKHELEYNLDLVRYLGIQPADKELFMPIRPESEEWLDQLFAQKGINKSDKLLAIHPGASCISKVWPPKRFAEAADRLIEKYGFKVLIIAGSSDEIKASQVLKDMHQPAVNLAARTSVSQLASVLKRCSLFISNDSGPVHIASSVGVPVISIFGRNQRGLSPARWGPSGKNGRFLHKEVGCIKCLAHNCVKEFLCLKAITVEDVLRAADSILA